MKEKTGIEFKNETKILQEIPSIPSGRQFAYYGEELAEFDHVITSKLKDFYFLPLDVLPR
jgi:hypothetical protein